jgi:hypothetical protein
MKILLNKSGDIRIFIVLSFILFSGCTTYQYVSIVGDIYQDDTHEHVVETDMVIIQYSFAGHSCPVDINIYNKLDAPIYVDWSKSSAIIDGTRYSYWNDEITISGSFSSRETSLIETRPTRSGEIEGTGVKRERVSFIPPGARINVKTLYLQSSHIIHSGDVAGEKVKLNTKMGKSRATRYSFSQSDTPLAFRSFITLSIDEQFINPTYLDHSFWVDEVIETRVSPYNLLEEKPNQYYNSNGSILIPLSLGVVGVALIIHLLKTEFAETH